MQIIVKSVKPRSTNYKTATNPSKTGNTSKVKRTKKPPPWFLSTNAPVLPVLQRFVTVLYVALPGFTGFTSKAMFFGAMRPASSKCAQAYDQTRSAYSTLRRCKPRAQTKSDHSHFETMQTSRSHRVSPFHFETMQLRRADRIRPFHSETASVP